MFRYENPNMLYLLLLIPVFVAIYILMGLIKKRQLKQFGDFTTVGQLMPSVSKGRGWVKATLLWLAFTLMVFGLARPQFGSKLTEVKRKGIELIIALDVSNSMLAQDIQPNRLERAKQSISRLVDQLTNDRVGLIVFAGESYVQLPVTADYASAKMFLSSISPGMVAKQGTAIGSAINLAANSFSPQEETSKVIIVISDGENHEDDPVSMAQKVHTENGIVIHAIGIGSAQGAPIPIGARGNDFLRDKDDNVVITKLDEETLSKIAVTAGGKYLRATNSQFGLMPLFEEINRMEKTEFSEKTYSEYNDQFQYLFAGALILLLLEFIILERKNRLVSRLNLFGENQKQ